MLGCVIVFMFFPIQYLLLEKQPHIYNIYRFGLRVMHVLCIQQLSVLKTFILPHLGSLFSWPLLWVCFKFAERQVRKL